MCGAVGNLSEIRVKSEVLSNFEVDGSVKLDNLGLPLRVIDFSPSDFNSEASPSKNIVLNVPSTILARGFKASVDNNALGLSNSDESDVVNTQAV